MIEENYTKERKIPMSDCIFCKIIAGEIPSATIYENDEFKVILDRFPSGEGHALILPKEHYANIYEIPEEKAAKAMILPKTMCQMSLKSTLRRQAERMHWR